MIIIFLEWIGYSEKIKYHDKFIQEDKNKIIKVNNYINRYWKCKEFCQCVEIFKNDIVNFKFGKINEKTISDMKIYLTWQNMMKQELRKYKIKYENLDRLISYENENKSIVYKILEIVNDKVVGSLASNYFSNEFKIDEEGNNGYLEYRAEKHMEIISLNHPITIFSEDIEHLNNKIMKKIELPKTEDGFNLEWADNKDLSLKNFKNIIQPIKYKGKNWIMIYGSIKLKKEDDDLKWSDEYIVNLAINESYTLLKSPMNDRLYTIETKSYIENVNDYYRTNYTQSTGVEKNSFWDNFFVKSYYSLPPTIIINEFKLTYDNNESAWKNEKNEIVLFVSNNKDSWYEQGVTGSLFIEENSYNILKRKYNLKFFAFTERFFEHYRDESSLQIEYVDDNNMKLYLHYVEGTDDNVVESTCKECQIYKKSERQRRRSRGKINDILSKYLSDIEEKEYECSEL